MRIVLATICKAESTDRASRTSVDREVDYIYTWASVTWRCEGFLHITEAIRQRHGPEVQLMYFW